MIHLNEKKPNLGVINLTSQYKLCTECIEWIAPILFHLLSNHFAKSIISYYNSWYVQSSVCTV